MTHYTLVMMFLIVCSSTIRVSKDKIGNVAVKDLVSKAKGHHISGCRIGTSMDFKNKFLYRSIVQTTSKSAICLRQVVELIVTKQTTLSTVIALYTTTRKFEVL